MKRLSNCVLKFRRQEPRRIGEGFGGYYRRDTNPFSSCNEDKALEASREKVNNRKPSVALACLE